MLFKGLCIAHLTTATHKIELCQSEVLAPTDPCGGLLLEVRRASAASLS